MTVALVSVPAVLVFTSVGFGISRGPKTFPVLGASPREHCTWFASSLPAHDGIRSVLVHHLDFVAYVNVSRSSSHWTLVVCVNPGMSHPYLKGFRLLLPPDVPQVKLLIPQPLHRQSKVIFTSNTLVIPIDTSSENTC